jgi:hypothetical protein
MKIKCALNCLRLWQRGIRKGQKRDGTFYEYDCGYQNFDDVLKEHDRPSLEKIAVYLWKKRWGSSVYKDQLAKIIDDILFERSYRLNEALIWTDNNKKELLRVNDLLITSFEKACSHAKTVLNETERKKNNNDFVMDYDICVKLIPLIKGYDELEEAGEWGFAHVLCEPLGEDKEIILETDEDGGLYLDKDDNWDEGLGEHFKDHHISYAIHNLYDSIIWSFQDIININKVRAKVTIKHESFFDMENCK